MGKVYSEKGTNLHPYSFDENTLTQIGRLVRVCADLEDALTVYIARLTNISPGLINLMLGRTQISQKVKIAERLTLEYKSDQLPGFRRLFGEDFQECLRCRNALAHSALLGVTNEGFIAFSLQEPVSGSPLDNTNVFGFDPKLIGHLATEAENVLSFLGELLNLTALREKRRARPLDPHPKSGPRTTRAPKRPKP